MTAANAARCIDRTIEKYEGTTLDRDPRDRGNWTSGVIGKGELKGTKYGIAAFVYPNVDIANLTKPQAIAIYRRDYWPKISGDALPVGCDFVLWDTCVNSGASRALKCAASALGISLTTAVDTARRVSLAADKVDFIKRFCASRRSFLIGLHNATYQKGWLRRVADSEAVGIAWWTASITTKAEANKKLEQEAVAAKKKSNNASTATVATGSLGVGDVAHATQQGFDYVLLLNACVGVVIAAAVVYFVWKYIVHKQRAEVFQAVAAEMIGGRT